MTILRTAIFQSFLFLHLLMSFLSLLSFPLLYHTHQVSSRSNVRCYFSGAESKYIDASAKWVAVPDVMLSPPVYNPLGPFIISVEAEAESIGEEMIKEEKVERGASEDNIPISTATAGTCVSTEKERESDKRSTRVRVSNLLTQVKEKERSLVRQQPVALESAVLKIAAARERAFLQRKKQEVRTCHMFGMRLEVKFIGRVKVGTV